MYSTKCYRPIRGRGDSQFGDTGPVILSLPYLSELTPSLNFKTQSMSPVYDTDVRSEFERNGVDVPLIEKWQKPLADELALACGRVLSEPSNQNKDSIKRKPQQEETKGKGKGRFKPRFCVFCKKNGEPIEVFTDHVLRDGLGRISCPILKQYNCPICNNGGGLYAHSIKYCPLNKGPNRMESVIDQIKGGWNAAHTTHVGRRN